MLQVLLLWDILLLLQIINLVRLVHFLNDTPGNGGIPATVANFTDGLCLAKTPTSTYDGVNVANSAVSHLLPAYRIYYSQITIQPAVSEEYFEKSC